MRHRLVIIIAALIATLTIAGCDDTVTSEDRERKTNASNYENVTAKQPAGSMDYSPTREGINKWIETWEEPGKISYVYITDGDSTGYYVLEGLPISYCASLTPPERAQWEYDYGVTNLPNPSMDAVFYSGSQCLQYYGFDAKTGTYIEFSIGGTQNYFLSEQPLPIPDAQPLGFTTLDQAKNLD